MDLKEDGRTFKMAQIEVKRARDGRPLARRADGKPLTPMEREEARRKIEEEDPVVSQDIMMEEFRRLQHGVIKAELKDFDYGWLRENQRDLYATIKAREAEFEMTEGKPLSVLLDLIRDWLELVREGYRLQTKAQPDQGNLDLKH